jgi:hypothetical protein
MAERSPEIEELFRKIIAATERGDIAFLERSISRHVGTLSIGTDPEEWIEGHSAIMQLLRDSMPEGPYQVHSHLEKVVAYREGGIGWAAGRGYHEIEGKRIPVRLTGVAHQEDGEWRVTQLHSSMGVPNAEMLNPLFRTNRDSST